MQILTSRCLQQQMCPEATGSALHRRGRRTQQFDPVGIGIGQRPRGFRNAAARSGSAASARSSA
jgi:hypothetical protein